MTKFSVEEVSPIERRIKVEVEPEAVSAELKRAYKQLNSRVRIPGFRPGKVPQRILEARFRDQVETEVIQQLVEHSYGETVEKSPELMPVSVPRVTNEELKVGEPFRYQAYVEVMPKVEPKDYEGIEIKKPRTEVPESEVDAEIERLREATSELLPIEGRDVAEEGDYAVVDFEGAVEGKAVPGGKGEDATLQIAEGEFTEGKVKALAGAKVGEPREVEYTFPKEHRPAELAGKTAQFKMTIKALKTRKLPELNDELAKNVGAGETLEEMRKQVREHLESSTKAQAEQQVREQIIRGLIERNPLEVPNAMVERAADRMVGNMIERLSAQGIDPRRMRIDFERMRESVREPALTEVKRSLLVEAVAEKEKLEPTEVDLDAKVKQLSEALKTPEDKIRGMLSSPEASRGIRAQIREEKTLAFLEAKAKIVES
ncbi:MAG TPA: trigger factor [Myxococcales bacterium]|jgi:trigger factor|nr:trigger factor [Myxococcales bacterium]